MFICIVCAAAGGMTKRLNIPNNMHAVKKGIYEIRFCLPQHVPACCLAQSDHLILIMQHRNGVYYESNKSKRRHLLGRRGRLGPSAIFMVIVRKKAPLTALI